MNRTQLPAPPNPASFANPADWMKATFEWMSYVKGRIETDSTVNTAPIAPFVVGAFTSTNTIVGTDATSNFLATLVTGMQKQGITAPVSQRITGS